MDRRIFGRRVIVGWNNEPTLRFGIHRERWFTAIGIWPLLIGIQTPPVYRTKSGKILTDEDIWKLSEEAEKD